MAMNFLGLGFAFGAKDMGLSKVQEKIAGGFVNISSQMEKMSERTAPAFDQLTLGLGAVDGILANQQGAVEEWATKWADKIDSVSEMPLKLKESFKPISDFMGRGAGLVANTWEHTFGKTFKGVGDKLGDLKTRMGLFVDAASPLTDKLKAPFEGAKDALGKFGSGVSDLGGRAMEMGSKWKVGVTETLAKASEFFKGRSEDISKSATVVFEGFDSIREGVQKMNELLKVNKLVGFISAVSLGALAKISGALGKIGTEGMNLTTGLEATMVGLSKSTKHAAANLGLTGKELTATAGKAAGMAHGLNIGADTATQAIVGFKTATAELGATGIKSAKDLALLNDTFGVNSQQFSKMLKHLKNLGFGNKEIARMTSAFYVMGQETQDVGGALNSLTEVMDLIQTKVRLMGGEFDKEKLTKFATGVAGVGAALGKFGVVAEKARGIAISLATSQVGAQEGFDNLFQGLGDDIPDFMKQMQIMGMSQEKTFKMMQGGPDQMIEGFRVMIKAGKAAGTDVTKLTKFVGARMKAAGIDNADVLVNFLTKGDDAAFEMMKTAQNTTIDLGKMSAAGFSTGRTLAESFELAKDAAISHFRNAGKAAGSFLEDFTKSARAFNKILDATSKEGGPLGQFVDKLREVHRLGAAGLLPKEMQGAGILLGEIVSQLGPLLGILAGAILFFPGLTAVLGPVVAIMGLFAINLFKAKIAGESWSKAVKTAFSKTVAQLKKGIKFITGAFDKVVDVVGEVLSGLAKDAKNFDWKTFFKGLFSKVGSGLKAVAKTMANVAKSIMGAMFGGLEEGEAKGRGGKIASNLTSIFRSIFGGLVDAVKDIDWAGILQALGSGLSNLLADTNTLLKKIDFGAIAGSILDLLGMGLKALGSEKVAKFLGTIAGFLIERIGIIANALLDVFGAALEWLSKQDLAGMVGGLVGNIGKIIMKALDALIPMMAELLPRIIPLLKKAWDIVLKFAGELPGKLGKILEELGPKIGPALKKLVPILIDSMWSAFKFIQFELPVMILKALPAIAKGIGAFLKGALKFIYDAVLGIFEGIRDFLVGKFPELAKFLDPVIDAIKAYSKFVQKWFGKIVDFIVGAFDWVGEKIAAVWDWLFGNSMIIDLVRDAIDFIIDLWEGWQKMIGKVIAWLGGAMDKVVKKILKVWTKFKRWFDRLWTNFKTLFKKVLGYLIERFNKIKSVAMNVFKAIWTKVKRVFGDIERKISGVWKDIKKSWGEAKTWFLGVFDKVYDAVAGPGSPWQRIKDYIVGIWSGKGGIKEKWENAKQFFVGLFDTIGKVISKAMLYMKDKLADALGPLITLFDAIWNIVEKLWVKSMHHEAADSMKETIKVHQKGTPLINKALNTVGASITKNFFGAYKKAIAATKAFKMKIVPLIEKIAKGIEEAFAEGLIGVAEMIDVLSDSLEGMMKGLDEQMRTAKMALASLEAAKKHAASVAREANREEKKAAKKIPKKQQMNTLIADVNRPEWYYNASDGMRISMQQQHAAMLSAFTSMSIVVARSLADAQKEKTGKGSAAEQIKSLRAMKGLKMPLGGSRNLRGGSSNGPGGK